MESMRRLQFGHHKHAEFTAHVHILDLHNVPLVEGECRIKWRFQGGMSLNTTNNEKVMGQALQTSISYLKDLRNAAAGITNDDKGGGGDHENDTGSPTGDGDHSLGGRFKDAISHASRTLRASTLSHASGDQVSPRSRSMSMPRSSSNGQHNPTSPTTERDYPTWKTTAPPDYFRQTGEDSHGLLGRPNKSSASNSYFGGHPSASPPGSPEASGFTNNLLSPTSTVRPHGSPRRQSTALLSPSTPPARSRRSSSANQPPHHSNLTRNNTAIPGGNDQLNGHAVIRSPSSLVESLQKANMPSKAEIKGKTAYMPLIDNQVRFDKHMVCAVAIPMQKHSKHLESSTVKLKVLYKVRTTPLAEKIGSRPAPTSGEQDETATSAGVAIRNHKTRINGSSVSISTPIQSGVSTLHINAKEAHEEICLGDLLINLSEFVSVDYASDQMRRAGMTPNKETWVTRRYLLQNGRTNALLRVAVKMDWISGVRDFTAPPLMKGQIISPKKQGSRGPFIKNRDKEKDKDKEKSSLYSAASSNSSKMYMQGDDTSSRSILSMEYESSRRPVSSRNAFYGRNGSARLSPDDASDVGSVLGLGHQWGNYDGHHHRHIHHHADHHYSGGFEFGLDDDRTDIDIIQAIFNKPETPPPAPDLVPDSEARASYFPKQTQEISSNAAHTAPLHSDSNHSEASENSRHRSPAQALAFLHRSKDKSGKGKQASLAHLGVEDVKGRKRVASAPSRSLFPPLRSGSRASQPVSVTSDDGAVESPDSRDAHHHHHGHHDDTLGPVVVHIPTRQEPIDIHSHPFRWKGKASATMHEATQVLHAVHTVADEIGTTLPVMEHDKHRAASVNIANLESDAAGSGNEGAKRRAPASAAAHIFRLPFKNRSSSALSSTASLQSAAPILEAGSSSRRIPDVDHETYERNSKTTSDIPRGSLDLQRTIRPSSEGDPTRANIRRMTSPTTMTATEEADLQSYVAEQLHSDTKASSSVKSGQKTTFSKDLPRSFQSQAQSVEAPRARAASSQLKSDLNAVPSPNSHTSSLSEEDQSDEDVDQTDLVRQVTNEEALGERARRLRDRGLLPTLSVTRSDELPARFPDAAPEL